jgi:hypothetical protein
LYWAPFGLHFARLSWLWNHCFFRGFRGSLGSCRGSATPENGHYGRRPSVSQGFSALSREEIAQSAVKTPRAHFKQQQLPISVRQRVSEICVEPSRPHIRIRRGASKGGRSRLVTSRGSPAALKEAWHAIEKLQAHASKRDHYLLIAVLRSGDADQWPEEAVARETGNGI